MELIKGGTLKQKLGKPLPYPQAVMLVLPVARGLAHAHEMGIFHRDVKPSNILITQSGEVVLTDFGIAKLLEDKEGQTITGTGVGLERLNIWPRNKGLERLLMEEQIFILWGSCFLN